MKNFIKTTFIICSLCIALSITGCKSKNNAKKYNTIISSSNIKSIDFKIKNEEDIRYDKDEYVTLTTDEIKCFVNNLNGDNLKYTVEENTESKYGNNKDTFIITYDDGSKTYFDNYHVLKQDGSGKEVYNEKLKPYNCVIGQNIFMDEAKTDKIMCNIESMQHLEKERDNYDFTYVSSHSYNSYSYRYYRTINGYNSTDYFDVTYKDGRIDNILKSKDTFKNQKVYEIKYEGYKYDATDPTIKNATQSTMYMVDEKNATPVETTRIYRTNGVVDIIEKNLYTGKITESQTHVK